MKTERNILIAFILNLLFSVIEFFGGLITGSTAILSDAVHDGGDALSIGVSYFLERTSKKAPDEKYTFGYGRLSVLGGFFSTTILILGSVGMILNSLRKIIYPSSINTRGMIILACIGVLVNLCAAFFTRGGDSLNQKSVNLHMLEDVLTWVMVLIGAVIIRMTGIVIIDPLMSLAVSVFILSSAAENLRDTSCIFLERSPVNITVGDVVDRLRSIDSVKNVTHVHLWSIDGVKVCATLHAVADGDAHEAKESIRHELRKIGVVHVTIELESEDEEDNECSMSEPSEAFHVHSCYGHHSH